MLSVAKRAENQVNIGLVIRLVIVVVKIKVKVEITFVSHTAEQKIFSALSGDPY
jgi:hypothetical protein